MLNHIGGDGNELHNLETEKFCWIYDCKSWNGIGEAGTWMEVPGTGLKRLEPEKIFMETDCSLWIVFS